MYSITFLARRSAWLGAAAAAILAAPWQNPAAAQSVRPLAYSRTVLPNGLVVLLNEDHSSPVVAYDVWYHVGAKDEHAGGHGFAHMCEHIMGQGSPNEPLEPKLFLAQRGGRSTHWAETTQDITHYYATIPSNQLETALWLESDRMAVPLANADSAHLASVVAVILQERAQQEESKTFGFAEALITRAIMDAPYQIDPIGDPPDLTAATPADAKAFCLPYYAPNNAVLALSGDFSSARAKALITKYFGSIPRHAIPAHPTIHTPVSTVEHRLVLEDARARGTQFRRVWVGAGTDDPDRLALVALGSILSRDRVGRLSKALVYDRPLATFVNAMNFDIEKSGVFQILITPRPGASLTTIEQVVDSVVADVREHGVTAEELEPYKKSNAVQAITFLQSRESRADTLAHDEIFSGDPVAYVKQVSATSALTPPDIQRVARQYLTSGGVEISLVPAGKLDLIAKPELPYKNVTPAPVAKVTP
ncbi:MAG TPA: pitrilysin family protein [Gemmatimonadaceae bacterium]|jgi:zinc protease